MLAVRMFKGPHEFLSNFYACLIDYDGKTYASVEHAFQAAKTLNLSQRRLVRQCTEAAHAKRLGRRVELRPVGTTCGST